MIQQNASGRRQRTLRSAIVPATTTFVCSWLMVVWLRRPRVEGDTGSLVKGTRKALDCLADGRWRGCGSSVVHFPLIQYLIATPTVALRLDLGTTYRTLQIANVLTMLVAAVALVRLGRLVAGDAGAWLALATALASPLLPYGQTTFREPLTAALVVCLVWAICSSQAPAVIAAFALVAAINQETLPPFLLALGLLAAWDPSLGRRWPPKRRILPLAIGVAVGMAVNAAFNVFRFGSVRNVTNLRADYQVPRLSWSLELWGSLWVSPNGGLLWFWTVPVGVIAVVACRGLALLVRSPRDWRVWAPRVGPGAVCLAHSAGLARWWSPWGWYAWGPRLSYPLIAAAALLAIKADHEAISRIFERATSRWLLLALAGAAVLVTSLPHIGATYDQEPYQRQFFGSGDERCPQARGNPVSGTATTEYYYECQLLHRAWGRRPFVLSERAGAAFNPATAVIVIGNAVLLALYGPLVSWTRGEVSGRLDSDGVAAS